jgi:ABC-type uncharacterized transport system permease subunit
MNCGIKYCHLIKTKHLVDKTVYSGFSWVNQKSLLGRSKPRWGALLKLALGED